MGTWAALIFALLPVGEPVRERADLVEWNHFFSEYGKPVFVQLIWYEYRPVEGEYRVRAWKLAKYESQRPIRDHRTGDWVTTWTDGETFREIRADAFRESWTQYDPELHDRDFLPKEQRRDFIGGRRTTP